MAASDEALPASERPPIDAPSGAFAQKDPASNPGSSRESQAVDLPDRRLGAAHFGLPTRARLADRLAARFRGDAQCRVRARLIKQDFKYPMLRREEWREPDPVSGGERVVATRTMVADHVMVKVREGVDEGALRRAAAGWGLEVRKRMVLPGMYLLAIPDADVASVPTTLARLESAGDLLRIAEPDYVVRAMDTFPDDTRFDELWGMHNEGQTGGAADVDINAPAAWDLFTGSGEVVIGVIDTGVDYRHPDLAANVWANPAEMAGVSGVDDDGNGFVDDRHGWDFANDDADPMDDHEHGTHCAGTIAAVADNGEGVAGVIWHARIMALKFLDGTGRGVTSDAADALAYASRMRERGVDIRLTSNSWGGGGFLQSMAEAIARSQSLNMLFVAAAGNNGSDLDLAPIYPAGYTNENLIVVAACDSRDRRAEFSNHGSETVDLAAPGVGILSTVPGGGYDSFNGTSMAAPHVAGVTALAWDYADEADWRRIRESILMSVDPVPHWAGVVASGGRLNAYATLRDLGMRVRGSDPAPETVSDARPVDFDIRFSATLDPVTVQPGDFTVNGVPADTVSLPEPNLARFSYLRSPVTAEGVYSMSLPSGAVARLSDGEEVYAWSAVFYHDRVPLMVASLEPADGSVVTLPLTAITMIFNQALDPASVSPGALALSQGRVVSAELLDPNTVRYRINNAAAKAELSGELARGGVRDTLGIPGEAVRFTFEADYGEVAWPRSFYELDPGGAQVFATPTVPARINPAGDTDTFVLELDPGEGLSAWIVPGPGLAPTLELRDASANLVARVDGLPGVRTRLPFRPVAGGRHTLTVSGGDSTGGYAVGVLLNAASAAGARDPDGPGGAVPEDLAGAWIPYPDGVGAHTAVVGALGLVPLLAADFETGLQGFTVDNGPYDEGLWHWSMARRADGLPGHSPNGCVYFGQNETPERGGDYDVGIARAQGALISPEIEIPTEGAILQFACFLATEEVSERDVVTVEIDDGIRLHTLRDSSAGTFPTGSGGYWIRETVDLSAFADRKVRLRFGFDARGFQENFHEGWMIDDVVVGVPLSADAYRVWLDAGTFVSALATPLGAGFGEGAADLTGLWPGRGERRGDETVGLTLQDGSGNFLTRGLPEVDGASAVRGWVVPSAGDYVLRVSGGGTAYVLALAKETVLGARHGGALPDAWIPGSVTTAVGRVNAGPGRVLAREVEPNDDRIAGHTAADLARANDISGGFSPVGPGLFLTHLQAGIAPGTDRDYYRLVAGPGDRLGITVSGLSAPTLEIYDAANRSLALKEGIQLTRLEFDRFPASGAYLFSVAERLPNFAGANGDHALDVSLKTGRISSLRDVDTWWFPLAAGRAFSATTLTPGDGPGPGHNPLDPRLTLYDPEGRQIAMDDNGGGDGRNASLAFTPSTAGLYRLEVSTAQLDGGAYRLQWSGAAMANPPPRVVFSDPAVQGFVHTRNPRVTLAFDQPVLLQPVDPAGFRFGGVAASRVEADDDRTLIIEFAQVPEGFHDFVVAPGAVRSLGGTPAAGYTNRVAVGEALPVAFTMVEPRGSQAATSRFRVAVSEGQVRRFVVPLDAGQLFAAQVRPDPGFMASLNWTDATGGSIRSAAGTAPGRRTPMAAAPGGAAGVRLLELEGVRGMAGAGWLDLALNAEWDNPPAGGADTPPPAITWQTRNKGGAGPIARASMLVEPDRADALRWYAVDLAAGDVCQLVVATETGTVQAAELWTPDADQIVGRAAATSAGGLRTPPMRIQRTGVHRVRLLADPGAYHVLLLRNAQLEWEPNDATDQASPLLLTGNLIGAIRDEAVRPLSAEVEPNDDGVEGITPADFRFANDLSGSLSRVPGGAWFGRFPGRIGAPVPGAVFHTPEDDLFVVRAGPGDTLTLHLRASLEGGGGLLAPLLQLLDRNGRVLATALRNPGANADPRIVFNALPYAGIYYVRAFWDGSTGAFFYSNAMPATYTLEVLLESARELPWRQAEVDLFQGAMEAGAPYEIALTIPGDGPFLPDNPLRASLELFGPSGASIGLGEPVDASAGRVALSGVAGERGLYRIQVRAVSPAGGAYELQVTGPSFDPRVDRDLPLPLSAIGPAGARVLAGKVAHTIDLSGIESRYRIPAPAGHLLGVRVIPEPGFQTRLALLAPGIPASWSEAPGPGLSVVANLVPEADGLTEILVGGGAGATGAYTLEVTHQAGFETEATSGGNDAISAAEPLPDAPPSAGETHRRSAVLGRLATAGDVDTFRFHGAQDALVSLGVDFLQGTGGSLRVLSPEGGVLAAGRAAANYDRVVNDLVLPRSGLWYAEVTGGAGEYLLVLAREAALDAEANDTDPAAQILTWSGGLIGAVEAFPPRPLLSEREPNDDGVPGVTPADLAFARDISEGLQPTGPNQYSWELQAKLAAGGDDDLYSFVARPGDRVRITMIGADYPNNLFDPVLRLLDPKGNQIAFHDSAYPFDSEIVFDAFAARGRYTIVADEINRDHSILDTYTLRVVLDTPIPHPLHPTGEDRFRLHVRAGRPLTVATTTPASGPLGAANLLVPRVELFDALGHLRVTSARTASDGRNVRFTHLPTQTGAWLLRVLADEGRGGDYALSVSGVDDDVDADNLPDRWERAHGLDPMDDGAADPRMGPSGNPDGDRLTNQEEFIVGSSPADPDSEFALAAVHPLASSPGVGIRIPTMPGRTYTIEYCDESSSPQFAWRHFATRDAGVWRASGEQPGWFSFIDDFSAQTSGGTPLPGSARYYRVRVDW